MGTCWTGSMRSASSSPTFFAYAFTRSCLRFPSSFRGLIDPLPVSFGHGARSECWFEVGLSLVAEFTGFFFWVNQIHPPLLEALRYRRYRPLVVRSLLLLSDGTSASKVSHLSLSLSLTKISIRFGSTTWALLSLPHLLLYIVLFTLVTFSLSLFLSLFSLVCLSLLPSSICT